MIVLLGIFSSVVELNDENLALVCNEVEYKSTWQEPKWRSALFKLNSNGDSLWSKKFYLINYEAQYYSSNLYDIEVSPDGGFIMAGYCHLSEETIVQQPWLVKTDSLGNDGTGIIEYKIENNVILKLYPNPAKDKLNMVFNEPVSAKRAEVIIYNIVGIEHKKIVIYSHEAGIDISILPAGVYVLSIFQNEVQPFNIKFIKEK